MPTKVHYTTSATATGGGRDGHVAVDDGSFSADLTLPKELGGPGGDGLNPEKLFASGYAACFMGALRHFAAGEKQAIPAETKVNVAVGIGPRADTGFGLQVDITVDLPGVDRDLAQRLIDGAHQVCPYSDATRGSLSITPRLA